MTKLILPIISFLVVIILDSLFGQSQLLSIIDLAAIYMVIIWFILARDSEEVAWLLCLVISIFFGLFRQQNVAILILGLTLSLLATSLLAHIIRTADYYLTVILGLFSVLALILFWISSSPDIMRGLIYISLNTVIAYAAQLVIIHRSNPRASGYKYK
jgi:uncharacterized membrane protein (GlpM family)